MKLTRAEAEKIAGEYNLGKVKSLKPFSGGWVNYNFDLATDKGNFVIRVLGAEIKKNTKERLATEFKVLSYLHEHSFPYQIPYPLKNRKNNYIASLNKTFLWIYPKLSGNHIPHYTEESIKSMARALATYHKYVKNINVKPSRKLDTPKQLLKKYQSMRKEKPNSQRNKFMLQNLDLFENCLDRIKNIDFKINMLPIHYDFHKGNMLFKNNQVVGILDFERMIYAPRMQDIAQLIKCTYAAGDKKFLGNVSLIVKEYERVNPLTKKEKALILPMLAKDNCRMFEVFYALSGSSNIKADEKAEFSCLKWTINVQKLIAKVLGWAK